MRIAVSGDWHLDNMQRTYLINGLPNRELDLNKQVEKMAKVCKEKKVDYFIIAGDLFNRNIISGYYFNKAVDYLRMFTDKGVNVIVIPGNHDARETGIPITNIFTKLRENNDSKIIVYDQITVMMSSPRVILIPHVRKEVYKNFSSFTEYVKSKIMMDLQSKAVVIGHFQPVNVSSGSELEMFSGSTRYIDTKIFKDCVVICCHVHKPQERKKVIIPGSPIRFTMIDRSDDKRFIIYDTITSKLESIVLNCQRMALINIDYFSKDTVYFPLDKIKKYKDVMVSLKIKTSIKNRYKVNIKSIFERFEKIGAKIISYDIIIIRTNGADELRKGEISMSPINIFKRNLRKKIKKIEDQRRVEKIGLEILENLND